MLFFLLRNNKLNLKRLGGSKVWSLVFTKSSSVEIRAGNASTFNCFSILPSRNAASTIAFLKGATKAYCVIKQWFFCPVSINSKQFILVSETLVGLDIPLRRIKPSRKPWCALWLHAQPVCALLPDALWTGGLANETQAAGERELLANSEMVPWNI